VRLDQVKFRERFDAQTIYLRHNDRQDCSKIGNVCGKTAKSWVSGEYGRAYLYQFREYTEITEHDFNEWIWAKKHQYRIGQLVDCCKDPAVIRAVAKLVNFTEAT
jgi:hypothetical protein